MTKLEELLVGLVVIVGAPLVLFGGLALTIHCFNWVCKKLRIHNAYGAPMWYD